MIFTSSEVTVNNDFFCHEWGDLPMIFKSDFVTHALFYISLLL